MHSKRLLHPKVPGFWGHSALLHESSGPVRSVFGVGSGIRALHSGVRLGDFLGSSYRILRIQLVKDFSVALLLSVAPLKARILGFTTYLCEV